MTASAGIILTQVTSSSHTPYAVTLVQITAGRDVPTTLH